MVKLKLRFDPLTVYLLVLAAYGLTMFVVTLNKRGGLQASAAAAPPPQLQQGRDGASLTRNKRSSGADDLVWLQDTGDLLQRLQEPQQACRSLGRRHQAGLVCGRTGNEVGCLDVDVVPLLHSCILHSPSSGQRRHLNDTAEFFFGCKLLGMNITQDAGPTASPGNDEEQKWVALARLMASGQLRHMKQLLIEFHLPTGTTSGDHTLLPKLRGYWGVLQMLSLMGFRRVRYMDNLDDDLEYLAPPKPSQKNKFNVKHSSSKEPYTLSTNKVNSEGHFRDPSSKRFLKKFSKDKYSDTVYAINTKYTGTDYLHRSADAEHENTDSEDRTKSRCIVLLYVHRPSTVVHRVNLS